MNNEVGTQNITLPGNTFTYMDCKILEGNPEDMSEKLVFTSTTKAGVTRRITVVPTPNGLMKTETVIKSE